MHHLDTDARPQLASTVPVAGLDEAECGGAQPALAHRLGQLQARRLVRRQLPTCPRPRARHRPASAVHAEPGVRRRRHRLRAQQPRKQSLDHVGHERLPDIHTTSMLRAGPGATTYAAHRSLSLLRSPGDWPSAASTKALSAWPHLRFSSLSPAWETSHWARQSSMLHIQCVPFTLT